MGWARTPVSALLVAGVPLAFGACETSRGPANPDAVAGVGLEATARLDFEDAPTLPDEGGLLASDRAMELLAFVDRRVPYEVLVFSGDGSIVDRLGESGDGPGEYDRIGAVAFDGSRHLARTGVSNPGTFRGSRLRTPSWWPSPRTARADSG